MTAKKETYPKINDAFLKCASWTFVKVNALYSRISLIPVLKLPQMKSIIFLQEGICPFCNLIDFNRNGQKMESFNWSWSDL